MPVTPFTAFGTERLKDFPAKTVPTGSDIIYVGDASNAYIEVYSTIAQIGSAILSTTSTASQVLLSGALTSPSWSTATYPATTLANQLLYSPAANTITGLATANNGVLITSNTGVPSISSTLPNAVQLNITSLGVVSTGVWLGTAIGMSVGGTNAALLPNNGGIVYSNATQLQILSGTSTANQVLLSGSSAAPSWSTATYPASTTINQILYSSANNTVTGLATANSSVLATSSTGVPSWIGPLTNGQLLIGSSGATPVAATLTQGSGVTIVSGPGTITISATGSGGTVTSVAAGTGLTASPSPITGSGTISLSIPVAVTNGGTGLTSTTANQLLYSSANNTIAGLATGNNGVLITSSGGAPSISSTLPTTVQQNITTLGTINTQLNITENGPVILNGISTSTINNNEVAIQLSNSNVTGSGLILRWDAGNGIGIQNTSFQNWLYQGSTSVLSVKTANNTLDDGTGQFTLVNTGTPLLTVRIPTGSVSYTANGLLSTGGVQGNSYVASATGSSGGYWIFNPSTTGNIYHIFSTTSGGLTFQDVINAKTPLVLGTNGSCSSLKNTIDDSTGASTWNGLLTVASGGATISGATNINTAVSAGITNIGNTSNSLTLYGAPIGIATGSSLATDVNIGTGTPYTGSIHIADGTGNSHIFIGNNAAPSFTTILGLVTINNGGVSATSIGAGTYAGAITIGNSSATLALNAPTTCGSTFTLAGNATLALQAVPLQQLQNSANASSFYPHTYCGGV